MVMRFLLLWVIGTGATIALDIAWLGYIMRDFYATHAAELISFPLRLTIDRAAAALGVWGLISLGSLLFVQPHLVELRYAVLRGAAFGFVTYGIYDLTNRALFASWGWKLVVADIIWGIILNAICAAIIHIANKNL